MKEYLSLDHLGRVVEALSTKGDMFRTVLSLYLHGGVDAPLPSYSEVLLCTSDSTTEERLAEKLRAKTGSTRSTSCYQKVPFHEAVIDVDTVLSALNVKEQDPEKPTPTIIHIDMSPLVRKGLDYFLFNLTVLGRVMGKDGKVWLRLPWDLYLIERTSGATDDQTAEASNNRHVPFVTFLPSATCRAPTEILALEQEAREERGAQDPVMDATLFSTEEFQRPYHYLRHWEAGEDLDKLTFTPGSVVDNHADFLNVVLRHCGIKDPSWAELRHFLSFLNHQLRDCEQNVFCQYEFRDSLPGLKKFVVEFMIIMSKDFATPSLEMADESPSFKVLVDVTEANDNAETAKDPIQYHLRRRWENCPHPYLFFNSDRHTMTFLGFNVDANGDIRDPTDNSVLQHRFMTKPLRQSLVVQRVELQDNFEKKQRSAKIDKLRKVMGLDKGEYFDPDESYELTTDNVKKILAIHMRFRCNIPVIIMGETGCGKTRLVKFMCDLQAGPTSKTNRPKNMVIMKLHGGVTAEDIIRTVTKAQRLATENRRRHNVETVLFLDEANTSEAVGLIKEIMCDGTVNGKALPTGEDSLKIVAAVNPYRRCQDVFLDQLDTLLAPNIARNTALKENVFMMVVCIELRIPLFLVGKPGSSKSLAKSVVSDAMQGDSAPSDFFKRLKQAHMVSFQCSPLATPESIVKTFHQCSMFQQDKDLTKFVSVVVLDEIGLAEDSPKMPLKTLHPLLEEGYVEESSNGGNTDAKQKKVAFVGISNWALDPAKMNRGIFLSRGVPDNDDLKKSARGICEHDEIVMTQLQTMLGSLAGAYTDLYRPQLKDREYFGLRDFYSEGRYLLILTKNYAALSILQQKMLDPRSTVILFGSSFPQDQEYTQVCRDINRIKVCMETGRTVVLLNLENLYESLYDALNQYYVEMGGQKYVDLGLGTHRVKCRVHKDFRLVVVAEKDIVYDKFPIPLINRLEKHFLSVSTILTPAQNGIAKRVDEWAKAFVNVDVARNTSMNRSREKPADAFIGYHEDLPATVVLQVFQDVDTNDDNWEEKVFERAKETLLQCATPNAVVRLGSSPLSSYASTIAQKYFRGQHHSCLADFLLHVTEGRSGISAQVTTHGRLLSRHDLPHLAETLGLREAVVQLLSLQQFDTEQQFSRRIRHFLEQTLAEEGLLVVQCDSGDINSNLIACASYTVQTERAQTGNLKSSVVFVIQLPRNTRKGFSGLGGGQWLCYHIDDVHPPNDYSPDVAAMLGKSVSSLVKPRVATQPDRDDDGLTDICESIDSIHIEDDKDPHQNLTSESLAPPQDQQRISTPQAVNANDLNDGIEPEESKIEEDLDVSTLLRSLDNLQRRV
uniref:AAA+ ATPase domain-containing protein n=1 Tax=Branchiostoma floridae TaxID=7739 RepID=C3Z875_BRAFL|eukprot:XP_002595187.1 hypothetical protein BRAFLDRAFT_101667 [Branchiostoma floridae]